MKLSHGAHGKFGSSSVVTIFDAHLSVDIWVGITKKISDANTKVIGNFNTSNMYNYIHITCLFGFMLFGQGEGGGRGGIKSGGH